MRMGRSSGGAKGRLPPPPASTADFIAWLFMVIPPLLRLLVLPQHAWPVLSRSVSCVLTSGLFHFAPPPFFHGLTLTRTASGHDETFQVQQNPNVAAMRWRVLLGGRPFSKLKSLVPAEHCLVATLSNRSQVLMFLLYHIVQVYLHSVPEIHDRGRDYFSLSCWTVFLFQTIKMRL